MKTIYIELQCQCHPCQRKPGLNLRSHVPTDLESCLEKLQHTWRWRVFNVQQKIVSSQHWGSACCLLWTRSGKSSERERLLCCLLWWRLRWAEPSQVLVNIIVIFAEGLSWSPPVPPWLIFNWQSLPATELATLSLWHLNHQAWVRHTIVGRSTRCIYDLITSRQFSTTTTATTDPTIQPLQIGPEMLYVVNTRVSCVTLRTGFIMQY